MADQPRPVRRRKTWQRGAILKVMEGAPCHLTVEEVHRRLRRGRRPIGIATVYRTLEMFAREKLVEAVSADGRMRYGMASRHHDHLVCLRCGEWIPLAVCLVPRRPRRLPPGFRVTGHQLELYGYCAKCQAAA